MLDGRISICMYHLVIALITLMERCKNDTPIKYRRIPGKYQSVIRRINSVVNLEEHSVPFGIVGEHRSNLDGFNFPCGSYAETTGLASSVTCDYRCLMLTPVSACA